MIPFNKRAINIDAGFRCTLECPGCARTKFKRNGKRIPGKDLTVEQFDKITDYFKTVSFCGTFSDPIFNKNFIEFLKICKRKNIDTEISNAASHKPVKWYEEAFKANKDALWHFGIDGLPEESHKHRKNQDGVKLFDMMLTAKYLGLNVVWQYIVFDYNENHIEEAIKLSRTHQLTLSLIESERLLINDSGVKAVKLKYDNMSGQIGWRNRSDEPVPKSGFKPKCILSDRDVSFSNKGYVLPCCWTNISHEEKHLEKLFSEKLHIDNNNSIQEIIDSEEWKQFFDKLKNNPIDDLPQTCIDYCSNSVEYNAETKRAVLSPEISKNFLKRKHW